MTLELLGGHVALDLINTIEDHGPGPPRDHLATFDAFVDWCLLAGLCSSTEANALPGPRRAKRAFEDAVDLRRLLSDLFQPVCAGEAPARSDIAKLDARAAGAIARRRLTLQDDGSVAWCWDGGASPLERAVDEIALAAVTLLTDPAMLAKVKVCGGARCGWMFLDKTKNSHRRWCKMSACGNTEKVRKFRRKKRPGWEA